MHSPKAMLERGPVMKEVAAVKKFAVVALFAFAVLFVPRTVSADELNQATKVTFSQPVQIPGQVLPAGTYTFEISNASADHNLVQIRDADGIKVIASLFTITADRDRRDTNPRTSLTLVEQDAGQPEAIVTWFFLDNLTGHEFVYPKQTYQEVARAKHDTFTEGE